MFIPIYVAGALFTKKEYNVLLSVTYPIFWLSAFLFILLVYGDQHFTKIAFAVNCFAIVYYTYIIISQILNSYQVAFV
jgi:hypothetical protein